MKVVSVTAYGSPGSRQTGRRRRSPSFALAIAFFIAILLVYFRVSFALQNKGASSSPVSTASEPAGVVVWDFERDTPGQIPKGWKSVAGNWAVIADPEAPTLPNTFGLSPGRFFASLLRLNYYYPLAVVDNSPSYRNFSLEAWFRTLGGRLDCSGGLVFGYQNPNDYFVMEAGCPTDRIALLRMEKGRLSMFADTVVAITPGTWYRLRLDAVRQRLTCFVDDRVVLRASQPDLRPGKIGLWAHADAEVRFDDIKLAPIR